MEIRGSSSSRKAKSAPKRVPEEPETQEEYEVEAIKGKADRKVNGKMKPCYLVMWKGYPREWDTWEVAANLQGAPKLINKFEAVWKSLKMHPPYGVLEEEVRLSDGDVSDDEITVLSSDSGDDMSVGTDRTAQDPEANRKSHKRKSKGKEKPAELASHDPLELQAPIPGDGYELSLQNPPLHPNEPQTQWLRVLEAAQTEVGGLFIVNEFDNEGPPAGFTYISEMEYGKGVTKPDPGFLAGCECGSCDIENPDDCQCVAEDDDQKYAYDALGRLTRGRGEAIFECNINCSCAKEGGRCCNRVVQEGRKVALEIFKCGTAKGWGVRAGEDIPRGTFICEYIGIVLRTTETRRRITENPEDPSTSYFFDLDFFNEKKYAIDAFNHGNVSRFFNHSCDSNLLVQTVFYDTENKDMHRLAAFASKDIRKGEELTFDYDGAWAQYGVDMQDEDSDDTPKGSSAGSSKKRKRRPMPLTSKRGRKNSRKGGSSARGGGGGDLKSPRKSSDNGRRRGCLCGSANCRRQFWF